MKSMMVGQHQVQVSGDRSTLWVHAPDGTTVGRFSRHFGIDVHRTMTEQLSGAAQCLYCTHEPPDVEAWQSFRVEMLRLHQVRVEAGLMDFS